MAIEDIRGVKQGTAEIISTEELWPGVYLLWAKAPDIAESAWPGQYVTIRCGEGYDLPLRRPLSFHKISRDGTIALLFAVVGWGTEWLAQRRSGEAIDLLGPLGRGFEIFPASQKLLLVAGGIGIAPLVALAEHAVASGRSVTLLIGVKTATHIYPHRLLPSEVEVVIATEDGSSGHRGMVTDLIPQFIPQVDQVFACGPLPMYQKMAAGMGGQLSDKPCQVLLEVVMGCGVGACLSCTVETGHGQRLACKDGPVFELNEVLWDKAVAPPCRMLKR